MPPRAMPSIEPHCVIVHQMLHNLPDFNLSGRYQHMKMCRHQAVTMYVKRIFRLRVLNLEGKYLIVILGLKKRPSIYTSRHHVVLRILVPYSVLSYL